MKLIAKIMILFWVGVNGMDAASTYAVVASGHGYETNPAMAFIFSLSPSGFVVIKIVAGAILGILCLRKIEVNAKYVIALFSFILPLYVWVVYNNIKIIFVIYNYLSTK